MSNTKMSIAGSVTTSVVVMKINEGADIPFHLLLLADETLTAIFKYLYVSDVYVAKDVLKEYVIAVFVLEKIDEDVIEIKNIAVDEQYQGQGIGSLLISNIKEIALKEDAKVLLVGTPDSATRQLNFYHRNGFRIVGVKTNFFCENYPEPIYENGTLLTDMIMLQANLT